MSALVIPLVLILPAIIIQTKDAQASNAPLELSTAPARAIQE
jgi:hypothetical protein